ncbi:MAG TPA: VOC family protein [Bacteriovoracaceae bacterium]|nr:VOC family protein [Bacteriovoracaceae bacterium]
MSIIPNYVPSQYKTVNIMLTVRDADKALEFYNRAFGAEVVMCLRDPNTNTIVHAEFKIADTIIMMAEENPEYNSSPDTLGGSPVVIHLFTGDVEALFEEAVKAGAEVIQPIKKQFYGDRNGVLKDPFGHRWIIATHMEDLTATQLQKRFNELYP